MPSRTRSSGSAAPRIMNRVGHAFIKRTMREQDGDLRRRGDRPLLLPRQLLRRQRLHPGAAHPRADVEEGAVAARSCSQPLRAKYFISGRDQYEDGVDGARDEKLQVLKRKYQDGRQTTLDGVSIEYADWHFNVRASNTEPLLRLNLEATTPAMMEAKRDEVLAVIRN